MSDPNDKQKCGTFVHDPDAPGCCIGCGDAPEAHTPRADGSAAEVKLPVGVAAAVKDAERIRLKAAMGKILGVPELHIIDLDDYAHTLASRVAELEARNASLERALEHIKITIAAKERME